ncbi:hypothetical protein CA54_35270 [Symmachiella macrocystis]|uniref:Uncharacterized protein n=1 Tax=Symmachiella macrocystis TaxID=2527985 RepID=A0A5C6BRI1_9PLAN|nr:hypothetical protein CA54_35270 [Symmachiella macrocystis]
MRPQAVGLGFSMCILENPCLICVPSVAKKIATYRLVTLLNSPESARYENRFSNLPLGSQLGLR